MNVPSATDPNETFEPFSLVSFEGFRIMTGENNGNTWVSFGADKMTKGQRQTPPPSRTSRLTSRA